MNDFLVNIYNTSNLIFMISLSTLLACFVIYQRRRSYLILNTIKYLKQAFLVYIFDIRYYKSIREDKYKIQSSDKICWVVKNNKIVEFNKNYESLYIEKTRSEIIRGNIQLFSIEEIENSNSDIKKIKRILNGKQRVFILNKEKRGGLHIISAEDSTDEDTQSRILDKQNEANLQLMNRLNSPVAIFNQDSSLVFFNSAFKAFSFMEYEYLNNEPTESEILDSMRQSELLPYQANFQEWKKKQLNIYETLKDREQWWYLQDGRTIRVLSQPNPMGGVTHIFENHTERLALENEAKLLVDIQKQTIDSLSEGIILFGIDGKIKLHNPKFVDLWQTSTNLAGKHIKDLVKIIEKAQVPEIFDEIYINVVSSGVDRKEHNNILSCVNNKVIYYQSSILPDRSILYTFTDITDSKKIEEALIEKNNALTQADNIKTSFMNNISHELRAPLQNIIGFTELIEVSQGDSNPDQHFYGYIKDIKKSGNELHHQINQILEITALESGKIESEYQVVNGLEIIKNLQDELDKLDFLNINYTILGNGSDKSTLVTVDVKHISRLFTSAVRLIDRHLTNNHTKECDIEMSTKINKKFYEFILRFDGVSKTLFEDINNLNEGFAYIPGSIENIIIDKYITFYSGEINFTPKTNQLAIKIPVATT